MAGAYKKQYQSGEYAVGYRFGKPDLGQVHHAFRTEADMRSFLKLMPERNTSPLFCVEGRIIEDDGTPDGLQIQIEKYARLKRK